MNLFKRQLVICFIMLIISSSVYAQDCSKTENKCPKPNKEYRISPRSRSIKVRKGRKTRIVLNVYGGRDYYFSTYAKPKVGDLQFKIISATTNQVLYDNSVEGLVDEKIIRVGLSQKLIIELIAPNWVSNQDYECAAFRIAYKDSK